MSTPLFEASRPKPVVKSTFLMLTGLLITGTLVCSHGFISPSQTAFFLYTLFASLFIGLCGLFITAQSKSTSLTLPVSVLSFVLLALYVLFHGLFSAGGLNISHIYIITGCLLLIALFFLPMRLTQARDAIFKIIAAAACIEAIICVLQYAGIVASQNVFFPVTGSWINPNVTAIFLAMSMPVFLYFLFSQHLLYKQLARVAGILVIASLIFLQCRTAWIGTCVSTVLILNHQYRFWQRFKKKRHFLLKSLLLLTVIAALSAVAMYTYRFKQSSADGRLLVWKLCMQMIAQKPVEGYGYGNFEQAYNLQQAAYFKSGLGTEQEKYGADYVRMGYNELLQNAVEGGALGVLLLLAVLAPLLLPPTFHTHTTATGSGPPLFLLITAHAAIVAYAVMSLINFTIQAIPALFLFIIYAALLVQEKPAGRRRINKNMAGVPLLLCGLYLFITQTSTMAAQWQNHIAAVALKEMHYKKAGRLLKPLQGTLSTSDSYWQNYGRLLFEQKKYATAVTLFNKAKAFTSNPDVYLQIGYCYELTGQMALAEKEFEVAACMLPNRLTPRYALLQLYLRKKDTAAALKQAKEMVVLREKVPSAQAAFFKKEAARVAIKYNAPFNNNITQSQIR